MLRSATKIRLNAKTIQNYDGMLLAPEIDFFGLILKADPKQALDPRITDFFAANGAKIGRTKVFGVFCLKITGEFNITKPEIDAFLSTNPDLNVAANSFAGIPSTTMKQHFTKESADAYSFAIENRTLYLTDGKVIHSFRGSVFDCQDSLTISSQTSDISVHGSFQRTAHNTEYNAAIDILLKGIIIDFETHRKAIATSDGISQPINYTSGISDVSKLKAGWLGTIFAGKAVQFSAKRHISIKNYLITSGDQISIDIGNTGNLCLEFEKTREWLNNPYPGMFTQFIEHAPGTIKILSETEFDQATQYTDILRLINELELSEYIDDIEIPKEYVCPISHCLMRDPVILGDTGRTFDKSAIQETLKNFPNIDPITNDRLAKSNLTINYSIRSLIEDFLRHDAKRLVDDYIKYNSQRNTASLR